MKFAAKVSAPRSLLAGLLVVGLLTAAMAFETDVFCGATLCFLAALAPALLTLGLVQGGDRWRAFCTGGLLPALAAFLLSFGLLLAPGSELEAPAAEMFERVASDRFRIGVLWLLAGAVATAAALMQRLAVLDRRQAPIGWLRPQFRLRTMFVLVAIVAAWAANYRIQAVRSDREQEALQALTESGASVMAAAGRSYPSWLRYLFGPSFHNAAYHVVLEAPKIDQETFERLERVPHLAELTIAGPARSEAELAKLIERFPNCHIWRE